MPDKDPGTALAKAGESQLLTSTEQFVEFVDRMRQQKAHVLAPVTHFALPDQWAISPAYTFLDPVPGRGDVYQDRLFCKDGEAALTGVALQKIANGAGASTRLVQLDDGRIAHLWAYKGIIRVRSFVDALWKEHEGEKINDLRDGSVDTQKIINAAKRNNRADGGAAQLAAARQHGSAMCQSKALNRAIRKAFALKQVYPISELAYPFVSFNLLFQIDKNDPQQKAALLANAFGSVDMLYGGGGGRAALPAPPEHFTPPVNHATGDIIEGTSVPSGQQAIAETPVEESVRQFHVTGAKQQGEKFWITTQETADTPLYVDDKAVAVAAKATMGKSAVYLSLEERNGATWVLELAPVAVDL